MTKVDWLIVLALNGSIVAYGFYLARGVRSSADWFLAGRSLPFWIVGLSMYATAIDASDIVADSGFTYNVGFSFFIANMVGVVGGWGLAAFFVFLPLYRAGMYTNAEYLEARFGPSARVLCAFIQVQYRTLVLAVMGGSLYWTVQIVCGWSPTESMSVVVGVAIFASFYTAMGGLKSVAITDVLQFGVMTAAAIVVWCLIYDKVGGWTGVEEKLAAHDPDLTDLCHVGRDVTSATDVSEKAPREISRLLELGGEYRAEEGAIVRTTPGWLVVLGFLIIGCAYPIVNHTQSMRMFAAKSVWDFKMTAGVAGLCLIVMTYFNLTMGVFGRALYPDAGQLTADGTTTDKIYPFLVSQLEMPGVTGLIVAGIFAAALSTYDSIGSSISSLLTRDVYARLVVKDRDDAHYLRVGQWLTPVIIGLSFLYMPFLLGGTMVDYFLDVTSAFVVPLLTLFLLGRFTRVHRASGTIGLLVGSAYGLLRLSAPRIAESFGIAVLPPIMVNSFAAYPISMLITTATMVLVSLVKGWQPRGAPLKSVAAEGAWLRSSQEALRQLGVGTTETEASSGIRGALPVILALAVLALGSYLCFVVLW